MKHALITFFAVLATLQASAITATKAYVDGKDAQTYTNALTDAKTYTDGKVAAATPGNYSTVSNKAMTAVQIETDPTVASWAKSGQPRPEPGNYSTVSNKAMTAVQTETDPTVASWAKSGQPKPEPGNYSTVSNKAMTAVQTETDPTVASWAKSGQPRPEPGNYSTVSNKAMTAVQTETDPTISAWAKAGTKPTYTASEVGAYPNASGELLAGQVSTIGGHLNAEDARFVSTNYNSATHMPEAYVEIKLPDQTWSVVWKEMTRWNWLIDNYLPTNFYTKGQVNAALDQKADRAWGYYDSTTGAYAPDGFTWISSPKIAIAANMGYQRTITAEGAIWVLESNGLVTETGGVQSNGFFRISDDEGNVHFEIVKGNKRTLGADASSYQTVAGFSPTKLQIGYSVVADAHPTLYICNNLSSPNWKAETDADCLANVTWEGTSGAYVAYVQGKTAQSALFVKATYQTGAETYIRNASPVSMDYMYLGGVKYAVGTATISGNTVLTLTPAP